MNKVGAVVHTCSVAGVGRREEVEAGPGQKAQKTLSENQLKQKKKMRGVWVPVAQHLASKHLNSNTSISKKERKKEKKTE
jgi:hypothetical protein